MKITCPHCKKSFKGNEAKIRPRKAKYKWYEFSGSYSYCPICNGRYQLDITPTGAMIMCTLMATAFFIGESMGSFYSLPVLLVVVLCFTKFPESFVKIEAKESI
ncbi:hypothetical protein [Neptuniibacter sp. CAU 1671]|uniref:hypothetical protein n=1 Tax=Neptuniibacter sp. CAU 1671 TaxID=3032593 RepID=UPI0023DCD7A2|nr:hypothetical protein [Neptuniibacter sp. CAU 1671]MDF2182206.1 hypothetical protein [Neptuniibacter sp. CAU 1671]